MSVLRITRAWTIGLAIAGLCSAGLLVTGIQNGSSIQKQAGALALLVCISCVPLLFASASRRKRVLRALGGACFFALMVLVWGEIILRVVYWDGDSFGSHTGPIVSRFERDFEFNRYDGPSRGPEYPRQPVPASARKILVQGDSITWGQGIKSEQDLYTSKLLARLRGQGAEVEMAVLAKPGREIDDHLEQLRKWGSALLPDAIIYQWTINDIELDKSRRPRSSWIWRRIFVYQLLARKSYFLFFVDYQIDQIFSLNDQYVPYLAENYSASSDGWAEFANVLEEWCTTALDLTPRVLVVMYPQMSLPDHAPPEFTAFGQVVTRRLSEHCAGVSFLDLAGRFSGFEDASEIRATRFDRHPGAAAHAVISDALFDEIRSLWPELTVAGSP